jgi:hypothetical protein
MRSTRSAPTQGWPELLASVLGGLCRWRVELALLTAGLLV